MALPYLLHIHGLLGVLRVAPMVLDELLQRIVTCQGTITVLLENSVFGLYLLVDVRDFGGEIGN